MEALFLNSTKTRYEWKGYSN
ncbi:uncharacterized protein CELE_Y57G11C.1142 [Caenorhabditis elegans]|uniref:Uncharacterized protein n=1 Tax=Caenorhabditis elegans TaxID=6239 RepID=G1K111_CAEEL|nr:Uncharacterized protein CELE_Y57G11C.1142 [Caenorhabditis elegans]CCC42210.1 Uncharacterized protein CELE_Y57G11C.1142 [Caenorhabditis elegans]|eukprot:NP_001255837.1 Uncharacterized protein CELE_Y57G11C.1142 [Caenorhabditis elegans]